MMERKFYRNMKLNVSLESLLFDKRVSDIILTISIILPIIIIVIMGIDTLLGLGIGDFNDYVVLCILSGTSIYGFYQYARSKYVWKIENAFPEFVRDLAGSRKVGLTLPKAIQIASRGNYGVLTKEIKEMSKKISWGSSTADAFSDFARKFDTPLINRIVSLIIEADKGGGSVADVLDSAYRYAREIQFIKKERKSSMASYVAIIYMSALVFLVIILILTKQFLPMLCGGTSEFSAVTLGSSVISLHDITLAYFYAAIIQAMGSGFVAGVFEEGRLSAGVKHAFILTLITWLSFKFLVF